MDYSPFKIETFSDDINYICPIIRKIDFRYYTWIHIPDARNFSLVSIYDVTNKKYLDITILNCVRERSTPWYRLDTDLLDVEVGYHKYKIDLIDKITDEQYTRYFSYTVQDDDLDKPYVYMRQEK